MSDQSRIEAEIRRVLIPYNRQNVIQIRKNSNYLHNGDKAVLNRTLYQMEKRGLLERDQSAGGKPLWSLTDESRPPRRVVEPALPLGQRPAMNQRQESRIGNNQQSNMRPTFSHTPPPPRSDFDRWQQRVPPMNSNTSSIFKPEHQYPPMSGDQHVHNSPMSMSPVPTLPEEQPRAHHQSPFFDSPARPYHSQHSRSVAPHPRGRSLAAPNMSSPRFNPLGRHHSVYQQNSGRIMEDDLLHQMQTEEDQWTGSPPKSNESIIDSAPDHVEEKKHDSEDEYHESDQHINYGPVISDIISFDFHTGYNDRNAQNIALEFNDTFYVNQNDVEYFQCYLYVINTCDEEQNKTDTSMGLLFPRQIPESELQHTRFRYVHLTFFQSTSDHNLCSNTKEVEIPDAFFTLSMFSMKRKRILAIQLDWCCHSQYRMRNCITSGAQYGSLMSISLMWFLMMYIVRNSWNFKRDLKKEIIPMRHRD